VNHMTTPCFTTKVRIEDLKAMDNYTAKKPSYIYNIMNMSDNLCFIRYIAIIRFFTKMVSVPYIRHDDPKERFKDYYVDYQTPVMDPAAYTFVDLLLPYVIYPNDELNERVMKIRNKYFPGKAGREIIDEKLRQFSGIHIRV